MKKSTSILFLAMVFLIVATATEAGTIALWTFETNPPTTAGPLSPDVGVGSATSVHAVPGTFTNPSGNGSAESWNSNSWAIGDYYQFQVSTIGQRDITISWDQTRSSAGPGQPNPSAPSFRLQRSADGTNFTEVFNYLVPVTSSTVAEWTSESADLSAFTSLDNQPNIYFRLTAIQAAQNSGGQTRVDNVQIAGLPVPEPSSLGVILWSTLFVAGRRTRT